MDDVQNPSIEGAESFVVFLSSPQGAVLEEPYEAHVVITDTFQDGEGQTPASQVDVSGRRRLTRPLLSVPSMQFEKSAYTVKEGDGVLHIPIVRTGDLSFKSSVRCFTRTMSAMVMDDFEERRNTDESRITFFKGEKVENRNRLLSSVHLQVFFYLFFVPSGQKLHSSRQRRLGL